MALNPKERGQMNNPGRSPSGHSIEEIGEETRRLLCEKLTPEQFHVTQKAGTEAPFCGGYLENSGNGTYLCVVCHLPLFGSGDKFDSGTGWPSFFRVFDREHVVEKDDSSGGMVRTEICCRRCDAHLGHLFSDGPEPTGLRYCLNSVSLLFSREGEVIATDAPGSEDVFPRAFFGAG